MELTSGGTVTVGLKVTGLEELKELNAELKENGLTPVQDPRKQVSAFSVKTLLVTCIVALGGIAVALTALLATGLFKPDDEIGRIIVIVIGVVSALIAGLKYVTAHLDAESVVAKGASDIAVAEATASDGKNNKASFLHGLLILALMSTLLTGCFAAKKCGPQITASQELVKLCRSMYAIICTADRQPTEHCRDLIPETCASLDESIRNISASVEAQK